MLDLMVLLDLYLLVFMLNKDHLQVRFETKKTNVNFFFSTSLWFSFNSM